MATVIPNEFTSFGLTEEEERQGTVLTITQKQVLHNQLALCASEKISLGFDPANPTLFTQREAYLRGQMDAIKYILEQSLAIEAEITHNTNH